MYVRNEKGIWFEIDEKMLNGKEVSSEKINELIAAEKAAARKKAAEILANLDDDTTGALRECLFTNYEQSLRETGQAKLRPATGSIYRGGLGPVASNDCWNNDCWNNDCHTNDCHANDCHANDCHHNDCSDRLRRPDLWDPSYRLTQLGYYGMLRSGRYRR